MLNIKNWTVGNKIYFLSAILLLSVLIIGIIEHQNKNSILFQMNKVFSRELPSIKNVSLANIALQSLRSNTYQTVIVSTSKNEIERSFLRAEFAELSKNLKSYIENLEKLELRLETRKVLDKVKSRIDEYLKSAEEIAISLSSNKPEKLAAELLNFQEIFKLIDIDFGTLGKLLEKDAQEINQSSSDLVEKTNLISFVTIFFCLLIGIIATVWLVKNLVGQLKEFAQQLIGEANIVSIAASNINNASQSIAQAGTEQAAAIQETAASIEEISAMVKKGSEYSYKSREVANKSHEAATKGKKSVLHMVQAIEDINVSNGNIVQQVDDSNKKISEIVKVIKEIENKTKVINDIVFQTKLLSFNASVEAARAGENGKGFAVVAEEVGNLAQMSGNAAKEISEMLNISVQKVEGIVNESKSKLDRLIGDGKSKVDVGTVAAKECGEILEEVVRNAGEVNSMISEISTASNEQAQGISEITQAMNQMDRATLENSVASRETASSSNDLYDQSESLREVVGKLEKIIYGKATGGTDAKVAPKAKKNETFKQAKKTSPKIQNTKPISVHKNDLVPSPNDSRFEDV